MFRRCSSLNETLKYKLCYLYMEGLIEDLYWISIETERDSKHHNRNVRGERGVWQTRAAVVLSVILVLEGHVLKVSLDYSKILFENKNKKNKKDQDLSSQQKERQKLLQQTLDRRGMIPRSCSSGSFQLRSQMA